MHSYYRRDDPSVNQYLVYLYVFFCCSFFFFFQAEDGIRDGHVTGVQTCALPISNMLGMFSDCRSLESIDVSNFNTSNVTSVANNYEIGRASCRERV